MLSGVGWTWGMLHSVRVRIHQSKAAKERRSQKEMAVFWRTCTLQFSSVCFCFQLLLCVFALSSTTSDSCTLFDASSSFFISLMQLAT